MFQDKYVFSQLTAFLNRTQFNNYVRKYDGNRYVKQFTCWNQLLAMMFGQLSNRESLRDVIVALEAHRAKQYHLGLGRNPIAKSTLAYAIVSGQRAMRIININVEICFITAFYDALKKQKFKTVIIILQFFWQIKIKC